MAIFADTDPAPRTPRRRSAVVGWVLIVVAVVGVFVVGTQPSPYVIEKPGPVFDTLGTTTVSSKTVPLIEIPKKQTYATTGALNMLTVTITGSREQPVNWTEVALAWLNPSEAILPVDEIYPKNETQQESNEQGAIDMQNSQKEAIAAALTTLGYRFSSTLTVDSVVDKTPASGTIDKGDVITAVNGTPFADATALRTLIAANGVDKPAVISLTRDGKATKVSVTPALSPEDHKTPIIGVILTSDYDFPFAVTIQLENVGGPSAGQMFALGIIDKLTPGSLTGGADVAGTGTITGSGEVGAIGGIRQKMYGARNAGATYFLAPYSNCNEVTGHIPSGLTVFAVKTLSDSLADLTAISTKADTSKLLACPAG